MTDARTPKPFVPERGLLFGGDYNPEQWSRETWLEDVELMRQAGVTTVTVGVFSWSWLEPEEGVWDFGWLDDVLELLHANGIDVLLATPTASPPPWFTLAHPDGLPVGPDGVQRWHGSRDTYCLSAPSYRDASRRVARALAERYGSHPAVVGWHVHNEYGTVCWCDHVAASFRRWLQGRYGDLATMNDAWGTAFWSLRYTAWEQVLPPRTTQYLHNPGHALDFRRFVSDELLACFTEQRDEIHASGSTLPVTTNLMLPSWNHWEQWSWAREQDLVSIDHYFDTAGPDGEAHVAYAADLTRSWSQGRPWLLMEQSAAAITVDGTSVPKAPDRMVRSSLAYVARGSQGALFFQWRASTAGAETWHSALVPHAGADSETFRAATGLGSTLRELAAVAVPPAEGPVVATDVAVLWHADGWWALETDGLPSDRLSYPDTLRRTHRALYRLGLPVDFVPPGGDLSRYRLLVVPALYAMDDQTVAWLERYVREQGGRLVVHHLTGIADASMRVTTGGYPGRLRDLLGVRVEQVRPLARDEELVLDDGSRASVWSELVHLTGAETVRTYAGGVLDGRPAVTEHRTGAGVAVYVSAQLDESDLDRFVAAQVALADVRPVLATPAPTAVEVVRRRGAAQDHLFVLNHGDVPVVVSGPAATEPTTVPPGGHLVVAVPTDEPAPLQAWTVREQDQG
ncbi:beta-galactosidase [Cellulomonas soli]|uniref:Beta-galactosidase n=1 Tax=Cellulomonas soli TaxID=931535 RepID=A0A512PIX0_9CELL|nr:beta-galactosidase [Cellulomonas soli]NYI58851.1 beta-galactosidase [Cellulomonas soli]GEP71092.1 beta-galactosidase [Cellulomonas soli]